MKKMIGLGIITTLVAIMAIVAGCSTWGNGKLDNPLTSTPYQSGRTFVVVDIVTEPFQPKEMRMAIDQIYVIAQANSSAEDWSDAVVKESIDKIYKDTPVETREMIFNVYKAMFNRIRFQIEADPDRIYISTVHEFFDGVKDALEVYRPIEDVGE